MPDQPKPFYLTTPIYYVNARPHIGHAYTTIVADVLARRHRLLGEDVYFLTGTDEHGQKIERSAAAANIPPQQFADQVSKTFSDLWARMGILRDTSDPLFHQQFIRTTGEKHKLGVQKLFSTLYEKGFIYLASYTGSYCVSDEAFIDAPIGTPCPDCGRLLEEVTEENFFFKLSGFQKELIELVEVQKDSSKIPDLLIKPDTSRNEVIGFLMGTTQELKNKLEQKLGREIPESLKQTAIWELGEKEGLVQKSSNGLPYVVGALKDLSISRSSFTWGIPVPPEIQAKEKTAQKHVIYVWLDALANYMTALGYGSDDETNFKKFWLENEGPSPLHLVGKEITRFHCVYWPAFLLAAELPLPKQITAHGWLLFDNSKMSKSKGNVVRTETILDAFGTLCPPPATDPTSVPQRLKPDVEDSVGGTAEAVPLTSAADRDLFAADVLRYYLLREIPFGQDGSFSFEALITRYNADLANGYGNLVSRTLSMIWKYFDGNVPHGLNHHDPSLMTAEGFEPVLGQTLRNIQQHIDLCQFHLGLERIAQYIRGTDQMLSARAPWRLAADENKAPLEAILYTTAESIRILTALLYPILPYATARVWAQLGLGNIELAAREGKLTNLQWGGLQPGTKLGPLGPIFPRADKGLAQTMTDMEEQNSPLANSQLTTEQTPARSSSSSSLVTEQTTDPAAAPRTTTLAEPALTVAGSHATTTGPAPTPLASPHLESPSLDSPQIAIDDFIKIDLRVAQVTLCERIPKADKLLRLEVDLGPLGQRQILSGIAEWYTPEEMVGRRIIVIANLAPRKMRGLESHGMLLAASEEGGKPYLATVPEGVPVGTRLK